MTYNEFINNIIEERGQWNIPEGEYFEGHHIIPKCKGGKGGRREKHPNIIWLFAREHFEAHKLLAEENPNDVRLIKAFTAMNFSREGLELTPKDYEDLKKANVIANSGKNHPRYGKKWDFDKTEEQVKFHKKRISEGIRKFHKEHPDHVRGKNNPMYGHVYTEEERAKKRGKNNHMYGKTHTKEVIDIIRASNLGSHWYNNGVICIKAKECPEGFKLGRINMGSFYNNGRIQKKFKNGEPIPKGFVKGSLLRHSDEVRKKISASGKGKIVFNNGIQEILAYTCPKGFVKGRIKRKYLLPDGSIKFMDRISAKKFHPDWIEITGDTKNDR